MNKKFLASLLVATTVVLGMVAPIHAKAQTNNQLGINQPIGFPENPNVYVLDTLVSNGYSMNGLHYQITNLIPQIDGSKTYYISVTADGLPVSKARITIATRMLGGAFVTGTPKEEINKLAGIKWSEKVKLSKYDAIYHARYAVYMNTHKDVTEDQVEIQQLSLIKINDEYVPCYSLKVSCENNEKFSILVNAENGEILNNSKIN